MINNIETISNILSWAICLVIWFRVHDLVTDGFELCKVRAALWTVFALALIANSVFRVYDETYIFVLYGAIVAKGSLLPALLLDAYVKDRRYAKKS